MISTTLRFKLEVLFKVFAGLICVSNATVDTQTSTKHEFFLEQPFDMQRVDYPGDERAQCNCQNPNDIEGGKDAVNGMFPYAVFIQFMKPSEMNPNEYVRGGRCGGTLVTDRHVLTAAHCCQEFTFGDYAVLSISNVDVQDEKRKISRTSTNYVIHPEYNDRTFDNDIALIDFDPPVELERPYFQEIYVRTAMIPARNFAMKPHTWITAIGWGLRNIFDESDPKMLQYVDLTVVTYDECNKYVRRPVNKMKKFCIGGHPRYDTCKGDSGSGIFLPSHNHSNHILVGITSTREIGFCGFGTPSEKVNVTEYADWIHENTLNATCSPCIIDLKDM